MNKNHPNVDGFLLTIFIHFWILTILSEYLLCPEELQAQKLAYAQGFYQAPCSDFLPLHVLLLLSMISLYFVFKFLLLLNGRNKLRYHLG